MAQLSPNFLAPMRKNNAGCRKTLAQLIRRKYSTGLPKKSFSTAAAATTTDTVPQHAAAAPFKNPKLAEVEATKPFSPFLTDTFRRQHTYLRISITERCNLRCLYCMPPEGVQLSPKKHLLTPPEIVYLSSLFVDQGVNKIRLTGGEPTVHPQILPLLKDIGTLRNKGLKELALTTNGLTLERKLDAMVDSGVTGINLSLDTLDPFQFEIMTRRPGFGKVMRSIDRVLELKRLGANLKLKINIVVIRGLNDSQILPFIDLTREKDLEVRFIEYMPFDGNKWDKNKMFSYQEMLAVIRSQYPSLHKIQDHPNDTSKTFQVPEHQGRIGFITSMTENFCGSCNRLRITSDGNLKVCLFGNNEVSLRDTLRENFNAGEPIDQEAWEAMRQVEMDRYEGRVEDNPGRKEKEIELLEVIGMAVKRKKARHAGIGVLEHMKNRPMILIEPNHRPVISKCLSTTNHPAAHVLTSSMHHSICPIPLAKPGRAFVSLFSTSCKSYTQSRRSSSSESANELTHITPAGEAHMVVLPPSKPTTQRIAVARSIVSFSQPATARQIQQDLNKKGDVLGTARLAGIMSAKRTAELIPLCHNIPLSGVEVDVQLIGGADGASSITSLESQVLTDAKEVTVGLRYHETIVKNDVVTRDHIGLHGAVVITATVRTNGQTGVEMEALTAASVAALTVYDMCKAIDKGMRLEATRVLLKEGGKTGTWIDGRQLNSSPDSGGRNENIDTGG